MSEIHGSGHFFRGLGVFDVVTVEMVAVSVLIVEYMYF